MKTPINLQLPLLATAMMLSVVWDLGYGVLSFESGIAAATGISIGLTLEFLTFRSLRLRTVFLMLVFVSMLDIFFLTGVWSTRLAVLIGAYLSWRWYLQVPSNLPVVAGVVFAISLSLQGAFDRGLGYVELPPPRSSKDDLIVHLVMDELGAFDSISLDLAKEKDAQRIASQYSSRGFSLYQNVASVSPDTQLSMAALMDSSYLDNAESNLKKEAGQNTYSILGNSLQKHFQKNGWQVSVVQPEYVNYCQDGFSCFTYSLKGSSGAFEEIPDFSIRFQVLVKEFVASLVSQARGWDFIDPIRPFILERTLPKGGWSNPTVPLLAQAQLRQVKSALIEGRGQQYVFAHILAPHFPWIYDERCDVKKIEDWLLPYAGRGGSSKGALQKSTEDYWAQSMCTHQTLLGLIDAVDAAHPGRVRFVIHGDHGPRTMARSIKDLKQFPNDEQARKNLLSPFVATRLASDRLKPRSNEVVLQTLISDLLKSEAQIQKSEYQKTLTEPS